ncbi:MAG: glutamyl-tRNA reductase, partial [Acidimicrobiaceae bacterium]
MSVVVIGLNHRTAPLDLLERTAVDAARLPKVLHDLCARTNLSEAVVLSTCNRIEVYAIAEKFHGGYEDVRNFFVDLSFLPADEFADHLYVHYD